MKKSYVKNIALIFAVLLTLLIPAQADASGYKVFLPSVSSAPTPVSTRSCIHVGGTYARGVYFELLDVTTTENRVAWNYFIDREFEVVSYCSLPTGQYKVTISTSWTRGCVVNPRVSFELFPGENKEVWVNCTPI